MNWDRDVDKFYGIDTLMNEVRCEECGAPVEDDHVICYVCAQRNDETEAAVNDLRAEEP